MHLESNPIPARDAQRAQTHLCAPGLRDPTETEIELCLSVSCGGMGQQWPATGLGACMGPFEGGCHCLHHLHYSLASGQIAGREHNPAHQQKIGLKIY